MRNRFSRISYCKIILVAVFAFVFIADNSLLLANPNPVGDYMLTVADDTPPTVPREAVAARGAKSKMQFAVTLQNEGQALVEAEKAEIEKVIYTVTFITTNTKGFTSSMTTVAASGFTQTMSGGTAIHTKETTDSNILSPVIAVLKSTPVGKNTANLSVTVYLKNGKSGTANHSIIIEGLECSALAYESPGSIKINDGKKPVWDMTKAPPKYRKTVIGHAMWKIEIIGESLRLLTADEKKTNWFKKYSNKKVGFSSFDKDQSAIQKALNEMYNSGEFDKYSVPGELSIDRGGAQKGKHGITIEEAKAGLKFIERHFGTGKDKYGTKHNCVDMAVEGLAAAGVDRSDEINKTEIDVTYRDLNNDKHTDGKIHLSLPCTFGEKYATP